MVQSQLNPDRRASHGHSNAICRRQTEKLSSIIVFPLADDSRIRYHPPVEQATAGNAGRRPSFTTPCGQSGLALIPRPSGVRA
jgi:hypothetical protein